MSQEDLLRVSRATGGDGRRSLPADAAGAPALLGALGADRLFIGLLSADDRKLTVVGKVLDERGAAVGNFSSAAPRGEVSALAWEIAHRLAPLLEAGLEERPRVSLGRLLPFVAASASLAAGDRREAARALEAADPASTGQLAAARGIGRAVWTSTALPAQLRSAVALATGDAPAAVELAVEAVRQHPKDVAARAARVRGLLAAGDSVAAQRALAELADATGEPLLAVAHGELALRAGRAAGASAALVSLLSREPVPRPVLGMVAAAAPRSFDRAVEAAALAAAERIAPQEPSVASRLAARAVEGGIDLRRALPLLRLRDMEAGELGRLKARVEESKLGGDPAAQRLIVELALRRETEAQIRAVGAGAAAAGRTLLDNQLGVMFGELPALTDWRVARIAIVQLEGTGAHRLWPLRVRPEVLRRAIHDGLGRSPFGLGTVDIPTPADVPMSDQTFRGLAHGAGADALLGFRVRPAILDAEVMLVLFEVRGGVHTETLHDLPGFRTGLVRANAKPLGAAIVAGLLALLYVAVVLFGGSVVVQIHADPGAEDELFTLLLSRDGKAPIVDNLASYSEKVERKGRRQSRYRVTQPGPTTKFSRIPPGRWYLHLFGSYTKANQIRRLGEGLSREIQVKARSTTFISMDLDPGCAEYHVTVCDDKLPIPNVPVWFDDGRAHAIHTDPRGLAILVIPRGEHVIRVQVQGMLIERQQIVHMTKAHEIRINLVWERRRIDAEHALDEPKPGGGSRTRRR